MTSSLNWKDTSKKFAGSNGVPTNNNWPQEEMTISYSFGTDRVHISLS